jgi:hypothetical protein
MDIIYMALFAVLFALVVQQHCAIRDLEMALARIR